VPLKNWWVQTDNCLGINFIPKGRPMNTKLLILIAWISYFALKQTADDFWRFCLIYSCVMATCTFCYRLENKPKATNKNKKISR